MAFQLSPGVNVSEIDLSTIIPVLGVSAGGFAGAFNWGPIEDVTLITDEIRLADRFGAPTQETFESFFTAANFLSYTNDLKLVRAANNQSFNAVSDMLEGLSSISITNAGAGYGNATFFLTITGGGGTGANASVTVSGGAVQTVTLNSPGRDYTSAPTISLANANTSIATFSATLSTGGVLIKNEIDYTENFSSGANTYGQWAAKYASTIGNTLKVEMWANTDSASFATWSYATRFEGVPGTSVWAAAKGSSNDEIHIVVVDEDGILSNGVKNTILERYPFVSKDPTARSEDGSSIYYKDVLNSKSKYVWWLSHPDGATTYSSNSWSNTVSGISYSQLNQQSWSLSGGTWVAPTTADLIRAYNYFKNADVVDVSLLMTGSASSTVVEHCIDQIAEDRKDCVVFFSPERSDVIDNAGDEAEDCVAYRDSLGISSSYAVMDGNWKYQFDRYNNTYRWVPLNGDIAGLCARTDLQRDPWFSPAGFNRGQIKNVTRLAWNPNKAERDTLYTKGVNPVLTYPGEGTILFGDKTLLYKPSAFDRINVRRLFIVLEKAIARASRYSLFEFNDQFTRAQFVALVEPYLRDVQGRRGIFDFRVVCDETNNTPEIIDRNEFVGDIYIKPARSINFIQLNFIAVRTGVAFEEIVGKF